MYPEEAWELYLMMQLDFLDELLGRSPSLILPTMVLPMTELPTMEEDTQNP